MPRKEILDRIKLYIQPFRFTRGKGFQLKDRDPGNTCGLKLGMRSDTYRNSTTRHRMV